MYPILFNPDGQPIVVAKDKTVPKSVLKYLARIGTTIYFVTQSETEEGEQRELTN